MLNYRRLNGSTLLNVPQMVKKLRSGLKIGYF